MAGLPAAHVVLNEELRMNTDRNTPAGSAFTGRSRARTPKRSVRTADKAARAVITLGGIGGIAAVSLVGIFLVYVALPLFLPAGVDNESGREIPAGEAPVRSGIDAGVGQAWIHHADGSFTVAGLDSGRTLDRIEMPGESAPSARSFPIEGEQCAFGYPDGSVALGRIAFDSTYLDPDEIPADMADLPVGDSAPFGHGLVERTPEGQYRHRELVVEIGERIPLGEGRIELIDQTVRSSGPLIAALDSSGTLHVAKISTRRNLLTGETTTRLARGSAPMPERPGSGAPIRLLVTGLGDNVLLAWRDGLARRYDISDISAPVLAEEIDLTPDPGSELTALAFLNGRSSFIAGDDRGRIDIWFRVRPSAAQTSDGTVLTRAESLPPGTSAVTAIAPSSRSRLLAVGHRDGAVRLLHATSRRQILEIPGGGGDPVLDLAIGPRDDALLAGDARSFRLWKFDAPHTEATPHTLFEPVWYEGYEGPAYVWQSSSADDDFEPKYSLVPLIFGTLKATLYSMLFGLPLALLAAIHTSEFLHPRVKARIKPSIELMASLPSVVLGFLAALVFAPFIDRTLPAALALFFTVPATFLLGAHLWQLLPPMTAARLQRWKLLIVMGALPIGILAAVAAGDSVERLLFAGDINSWLDGQIGSGVGGWVFLLLPLSAIAAALIQDRSVNPWLRRVGNSWSRRKFALVDLGRFVFGLAATLGIALLGSWLLAGPLGWDPRGSFVDTYVQRNALVVGFVMGFAIIPIIYTIAEDSLSAVPDHLRAASLGAGATPWQTAIRVVVPPAMSGLFSAAMIGLGRAVGETMIVLMAAGNTPVMEWNIFNGFRTLSANIAVELPEAVRGSTHFRTLFLAALTLFVMTFILNTVAEAVRLRFRRKAYQL